MRVCRKNFVPHYRKIGVIQYNFKHFNTILNSGILLNLIRKIKYLTEQFQFCFCFFIGNTKQLYCIFALAIQLTSLQTTCYICFVLSLHSAI